MKKVLAVVLAAVLAFGMASVGFAASNKLEIGENFSGYNVGSSFNGVGGIFDYDWEEKGDNVRPGAEESFYMFPGDFVAEDGGAAASEITTSKLSSSNITVKRKVSKGSDLIDTIEFKNAGNSTTGRTVYIKVELIDPFVSTSDKDFDFTVYLAKKGTKNSETELQITGTMENEVIEVDEGEDEVNLSEGHVAKALAYVKDITVDTGNGLFIDTKMFEDKKYYAKSTQDITAADDAVITRYPEIDTIYTLNSINMSSAGNQVWFDIDETYYVYNADGQYIGTTNDKLPFSSKYYLATARIEMGGDTDPVESGDPADEVPVDTQNPQGGGDDVPANVNDNPGTGANGFVNVAVVTGMIALAAAGAVSMKK